MRTEDKCGIYVVEQVGTGRFYIGSSAAIYVRWYQHRRLLAAGKHHAPFLQHAWTKYGADAFTFSILEECVPDKATLLAREQEYIDAFRPAFNVAEKAGSRLGVPVSAESRAKISATARAMEKPWRTPKDHCEKGHPFAGDNLRINAKTGQRMCKACHHDRYMEHRALKGRIKPTCRRGHPWTPESTTAKANGARTCRICLNENGRERLQRLRAADPLPPRKQPMIWPRGTHCRNGHERTPENTHARTGGRGECRVCRNASERAAYAAGRRD